ncbi:MAG: PEP-CTERM sorting domain-containing protein [Verrucomicrobia bacterium]|nr:PEP-CTERM sorting domain-containing protein [Verrucomicrobiota bacterium]
MNNASPSRKSPALPFTFCARALGVVLLLGCSFVNGCSPSGNSSFTGLGHLPDGTNSYAGAVSVDGKVIVGESDSASGLQAFRWTAADGMVGLGFLPGGTTSWTRAVSSNGSVIVGESYSATGRQPFRWTVASGMVGLGHLPGATTYGHLAYGSAEHISKDGLVVVGQSDSSSGLQAFLWTAEHGMVGIGFLPDEHKDNEGSVVSTEKSGPVIRLTSIERKQSKAFGVSADGSVIVGESGSPTLGSQAFRWTKANGMAALRSLPHESTNTCARAVSANGSVIVGWCWNEWDAGVEAYRWTAASGIVQLGKLPGRTRSMAYAVSNDGEVVVGNSFGFGPEEAFIWDSLNGMRSLKTVLIKDYNLDLASWVLHCACDISSDRKTIIGNGKHNGHNEAWIAHLDRPLNAPAGKVGGK